MVAGGKSVKVERATLLARNHGYRHSLVDNPIDFCIKTTV